MGGGPPFFPPDSSCPVVLWIPLRGLVFVYRDFTFFVQPFQCCSTRLLPRFSWSLPLELSLSVWALPFSLAATWRIDFSFFSSRYLDVSVHAVSLPLTMCSSMDTWVLPQVGSPIRISPDLCLLATPRSVSPLAASFFGSKCLGILHTPFVT